MSSWATRRISQCAVQETLRDASHSFSMTLVYCFQHRPRRVIHSCCPPPYPRLTHFQGLSSRERWCVRLAYCPGAFLMICPQSYPSVRYGKCFKEHGMEIGRRLLTSVRLSRCKTTTKTQVDKIYYTGNQIFTYVPETSRFPVRKKNAYQKPEGFQYALRQKRLVIRTTTSSRN